MAQTVLREALVAPNIKKWAPLIPHAKQFVCLNLFYTGYACWYKFY